MWRKSERWGRASSFCYAWQCKAKQGNGKALPVWAGLGSTHCGEKSPQKSGPAGSGSARLGRAWLGYTHCIPRGAEVWQGSAGLGAAGSGVARQTHGKHTASHGVPQFGAAGRGVAGQGGEWHGTARQTHCPSRRAEVCEARRGMVRRGSARRGRARQTHSIPAGVLKFAGNTNNERKTQWKTQ